MGLDTVELVMEVEDHFRVSLSQEDCSRVRSVSDLAALVVKTLSRVKCVCPTARSFLALRRTATRVTQHERDALRPGTPLELVASLSERRRVWRRLRKAHRFVPRLMPSARTRSFLRAFGWTLFVGWLAGTAALIYTLGGRGVGLGLLLLPAILALAIWTWDLLSTELPDGCATLGELARRITPTQIVGGETEVEHRVLDDVRCITALNCGLRIEDVKPESRFVDDLGMD